MKKVILECVIGFLLMKLKNVVGTKTIANTFEKKFGDTETILFNLNTYVRVKTFKFSGIM